mmetsp:Transcript_9557/g.12507  ORF Transcript_9557/g.12507 Transcript_9557/m.12507 type:complete len:221 (-) Transcript_9557:779-1441(-)
MRRGIALDKCPGVRPIVIGEVRQRIEAKAMALVIGINVTEVCGADNLCAGTKAGIEGGVHAVSDFLSFEETECLILVDASNAFNALAREAALWNCRILWPRCSRSLFNTYRGYARIYIPGSDEVLLSQEGTTQGDPLAMLMYGLGVYPLIMKLKDLEKFIQIWYADDSSCGGRIKAVREWMEKLIKLGPKYGYFPEPSKCIVVMKEGYEEACKKLLGILV